MSVVNALILVEDLDDILESLSLSESVRKSIGTKIRSLRKELLKEISVTAEEPVRVLEAPKALIASTEPKPPFKLEEEKINQLSNCIGLPDFISTLLLLEGTNATQLGKSIGVSSSAISYWRQGKGHKPSAATRQRICYRLESIYGVPIKISRRFIGC